jgi:hypothetical protein
VNINLSISSAPGIVDHLVLAVYAASAPATCVASHDLGTVHTAPVDYTFSGLPAGSYYVITYENSDGSVSGTIRNQFIYDPNFTNATIRPDLFITADTTSGFASGQASYVDASLVGWTYGVEWRGIGTLNPGTDYIQNNTGGWTLSPPNNVIAPGAVFVMHFQPQITTQSASSGSSATGQLFTGFKVVTADITLAAADMGKIILAQGINPTLNITMPAAASFPDNTIISILSSGGNHINAAIIFGDSGLTWLGQALTKIWLGQSEEIIITKNGSTWYVLHADGNFRTVGEILDHFVKNQLNTSFGDGQTRLRANYPRWWWWVQQLPSSQLISDTSWNFYDNVNLRYPNKGFYSTGDGSTTFRVPLLYSPGFTRGVDGSARLAGSFEPDAVGNFMANITGAAIKKSGTDTLIIALGAGSDANFSNGTNNVQDNVPFQGTQFVPGAGGGSANGTVNNETRPADIGVYKCIRT